MLHLFRWTLSLGLLTLLISCAGLPDGPAAVAGRHPCQIVYDASSSGTKLYIYQKRGSAWTEHGGPKTVALADPVRQNRGKTHADIEAVTSDVVAQLDRMAQAGPADAKGKPAWSAFDWQASCTVTDAMVLATGGMRIAEHEHPDHSRELWRSLQRKLQDRVGASARIQARTLTGFEEGLYAWLAVREGRNDHRFGIAEMGGASSQVAFPCPGCDATDDAVRSVIVKGQTLSMYSYSFLGLGQDEAPKTLGQPASCAYGVALSQPGWQRDDCASRIDVGSTSGLRDPYNFTADGLRGTQRAIPTARADVADWVLTGAFNYMSATGVATCCESKGQCFDAPSACFRAVYFEKYLDLLGIPDGSQRVDASWTHGAVLCAESQCLSPAAPPLTCRWSATGCL